MQISLNNQLERQITERVKSGQYASPEDVVAAAIRALEHEEQACDFAPGELDRLIEEGEASGPPLDAETVFAELRVKHQARKQQS